MCVCHSVFVSVRVCVCVCVCVSLCVCLSARVLIGVCGYAWVQISREKHNEMEELRRGKPTRMPHI